MNRGLNCSDPHAQALKIGEELGELYEAFLKEHEDDELDAVGDLQVTLIAYCLQRGIDYKNCLSYAYKVIENRKGKMIDGTFCKRKRFGGRKMKYKKGDKVVAKIDEDDVSDLNNGYDPIFCNEQVLGKLEDFMPSEEKIKMTAEEKKEFDKLKGIYNSVFLAFIDIDDNEYPKLYGRLFGDNDEKHYKAQIEFTRAWDNPSRIEVEKEEKYYVHLFKNDPTGYLNHNTLTEEYCTGSKGESDNYKTKFTNYEITKMHFDSFKLTDEALEEVEDENYR